MKKPNIVYQKIGNNTYAYEDYPTWDKEKKQSRSKRVCLGRVDPETKELIKTRPYGKTNPNYTKRNSPLNNLDLSNFKYKKYGSFHVFNTIVEDLGVDKVLEEIFPNNHKEILSFSYFRILSQERGLYKFDVFDENYYHPCGHNITSQDSSNLISDIKEIEIKNFLSYMKKFIEEGECIAYDITSITSYSKNIDLCAYGVNKEHDVEKQINLIFAVGEKTRIPVYFRVIKGNIADTKTVTVLNDEMNALGYSNVAFTFDRGFFSYSNIVDIENHGINFIMGAKFSSNYIKENLDLNRDKLLSFENLDHASNLYSIRVPIKLQSIGNGSYTGNKKLYIYYYYDEKRNHLAKEVIKENLQILKQAIIADKLSPILKKRADKFFKISRRNGSISCTLKKDVYEETVKNFGYFSIVSNLKKDPIDILIIYREKDVIEKKFTVYKEKTNGRRLGVHHEKSVLGKVFISFLATIIYSEFQNRVRKSGLLIQYKTYGKVIQMLDEIKMFEFGNNSYYFNEIPKKHVEIFHKLKVTVPCSIN